MPSYNWFITQTLDTSLTVAKINAMRKLGVPYPAGYEKIANAEMAKQAQSIADDLAKNDVKVKSDKEIIAIIAYLQRLGMDIKADKTASNF